MLRTLLAAAVVVSFAGPVAAREVQLVEDEAVEAALAQSGANRPELEKALAHYATQRGQKAMAMRFLVANMPGKGHVLTALKTAKGDVIPYDPTAYPDFAAAQKAMDQIERIYGKVDFDRTGFVADLETVKADFLVRHLENAWTAWQSAPPSRRVSFLVFLDYVLPYRGTEEPLEDWLTPMLASRPKLTPEEDADPRRVWKRVQEEVAKRIRFDERYYLHPTDQGFAEMGKTRCGRCEDIANLTTYLARAMGLATATDYTPAWGHRDNNHAWNVLLDPEGNGCDPAQAHAAKVYRKRWALPQRRDDIRFFLPPGREAPNRFLANRAQVDVTMQYEATTSLRMALDPTVARDERVAYLAVFNGGEWIAVAWNPAMSGESWFTGVGRGILYLPVVHDGKELRPAAPPRVLQRDGLVDVLSGTGAPTSLVVGDTSPEQVSVDTGAKTPPSHLTAGTTYVLHRWDGAWKPVGEAVAGAEPLRFEGLPADGLYWLVAKESRRLERPFTIEDGAPRFW